MIEKLRFWQRHFFQAGLSILSNSKPIANNLSPCLGKVAKSRAEFLNNFRYSPLWRMLQDRNHFRSIARLLKPVILSLGLVISLPLYADSYYLQLGAFSTKENAKQFIRQLELKARQSAEPIINFDKTRHLYVVVVEPFKSQAQALRLQRQLNKNNMRSLIKPYKKVHQLYRFSGRQGAEYERVKSAYRDLHRAIKQPEFLLKHSLHLPISPAIKSTKNYPLSVRDAVLLSLRYNPNIQNSELDRVLQRYQLRIAENKFELQYALTGQGSWQQSKLNAIEAESKSAVLTPELSWNSSFGTATSLSLSNTLDGLTYNPALSLKVSQPLLRGFGQTVTLQALNDALDSEISNKLSLRQSIIDQVTTVLSAYRSLIQSNNSLETARHSLAEAKKTYWVNEQKIKAGQLAPTDNVQQAYQISNLGLSVRQAENGWQTSKQALLTAIGLDPEMKITVPSDVLLDNVEVPKMKPTIEYALKHNTAYVNTLIGFRSKQRSYLTALNEQLWKLDLNAEMTRGTSTGVSNNSNIGSLFNGRNTSKSVSLSLSVPIDDLANKQKLISAKINLEKDRILIMAAKRALITTIKNSIVDIQSQVSQFKLAKRQLELAQRSYQIEIKKQRAGIATSLDVTNTQNQVIDARKNLIGVKVSYLNAISSLQKELGTTLDEWKIDLRFR